MIELNPGSTLTLKSLEPLNAGTPLATLGRDFVTPADEFFIRSHGNIPAVNPAAYCLVVDGLVEQPLSLSLAELESRFASYEAVATLQCAGNRRAELQKVKPIVGEVNWTLDGISTGVWTGYLLADLLAESGVQPGAGHVWFDGLDRIEKENRVFSFGSSIPLVKALGPEVLLAYRLNGQPLSAEHGFPLRVVVPGYIGARSVKWLGRIRVAEQPSDNFFQTRAYKVFPSQVGPNEADWSQSEALAGLNVNSVITMPQDGATLPVGKPLIIEGYAVGAEGHAVEKVELSLDQGKTWQPAEFIEHPVGVETASMSVPASPANSWNWRLWQTTLQLPPGQHCLVVRATDDAGNQQPPDLASVWNFKGYMNNAWHRVNLDVTG